MQFPLREKIAGEIALSEQPGKTMRKWREELRITQTDLAHHMRVSPSVISDYEAGRRTSPGIKTIHRLVDALLEIDQRTGQKLSKRFEEYSDVIPSMRDWSVGMRAGFMRARSTTASVISASTRSSEARSILWRNTMLARPILTTSALAASISFRRAAR